MSSLARPASRKRGLVFFKRPSGVENRLAAVGVLAFVLTFLSRTLLSAADENTFLSFLHSMIGIWEGRGSCLVFLIAFSLPSFYAAGFLQRLYSIENYRQVWWRLADMVFGLTSLCFGPLGILARPLLSLIGFRAVFVVVSGGKIDSRQEKSASVRMGGPASLVIYEDSAVVLEKDGHFTRVGGPGFKRVDPFETIREVIDLRPQVQSVTVSGLTKDGIPIQVRLEIECQIRPWSLPHHHGNLAAPKTPYPFRDKDVAKAAYNKVVANGDPLRWDQVIRLLAQVHCRRLLRQSTLDKLIEPERNNPQAPLSRESSPRWKLQAELHKLLVPRAHLFGATVLRVTFGPIEIEEMAGARQAVEKERVSLWQAEWQKRARLIQNEAELEVARLKELGRAQAQAAMVTRIAQSLPRDLEPAEIQRVIALRMLESLEEMAFQSYAQSFLPQEAISVLQNFHQVLQNRSL